MSDTQELIDRIVSESRVLSLRLRVELIRRLATETLECMDMGLDSKGVGLHNSYEGAATLMRFLNESAESSIESLDQSDVPF